MDETTTTTKVATMDADALRKALRELARVVDRRPHIPILGNVFMESVDGRAVRLVATDLAVSLTVELAACGDLPRCTVPVKALQTAIGKRKGLVAISWNPNGSRLGVEAGGTAEIVGITARDFPKISEGAPETCRFPGTAAALFEYVLRAASADETRAHLCGVLMEKEGADLAIVATDGHRLHHADLPFEGTFPAGEVLIPAKAIGIVARAKGNVGFGVASGFATFRYGNATLTARLVDARFPPWRQVVPKDESANWEAEGHGGQIAALFREVGAFAGGSAHGVKVQAEGGDLLVTTDNPDLGQRSGRVGLRTVRPAADGFAIGFNAYLVEAAVEDLGDNVRMQIGAELDPAKFSNGNRFAVVMPMRIA